MRLIAGLGNYPAKYNGTRHNIGFDAIDAYLSHTSISPVWKKGHNGVYFKSKDVFFLKPYTYMNLSGNSIGDLIRYYNIENDDVLVIHDEIDFPIGRIKIARNRGSGGHNGVQSVINSIGKDFYRIRVGIRNEYYISERRSDFVLSAFNKSELEELNDNVYPLVYKIIESFKKNNIDKIMNDVNKKN